MPALQQKPISRPSPSRTARFFARSSGWIFLTLSLALVAFVFPVLSSHLPEKSFLGLSAQQSHLLALTSLRLLAAFFILAVLTILVFSRVAGSRGDEAQHARAMRNRGHVSLQQFVAVCAPLQISPRVAAQVYAALRKHYRGEMQVQLDDHLFHDLHLGHAPVLDLVGELLVSCHRTMRIRRPYDVTTVFDLLMYIEGSPLEPVAQFPAPELKLSRPRPVHRLRMRTLRRSSIAGSSAMAHTRPAPTPDAELEEPQTAPQTQSKSQS